MDVECPVCASEAVRLLYDFGVLPISVAALDTPGRNMHPVRLYQCRRCTHVFNSEFTVVPYADGCTMYNSGSGWKEHLRKVAEVAESFKVDNIIEVGAGDCSFLASLRTNARKLAIDPAKNTLVQAMKYGIDARRAYFQAYTDLPLEGRNLIIMRHLLEHIRHPRRLIDSIICSGGDNTLLVEVPCCEKALRQQRIEDWTYEHVQHFTGASLATLLGHGRVAYSYDDEVLVATARYRKQEPMLALPLNIVREGTWISEHLDEVVFWGGAGKSANFYHVFGVKDAFVVDSDRRKWGKKVPGTDMVIHSPGSITDQAYIFATTSWRAEDIKADARRRGINLPVLKFTDGAINEA